MAITVQTRKALWGPAHNQCAYPGCQQALVEELPGDPSAVPATVVIGEEAHIRAQSKGGPRYDPAFPKDRVDSAENLVLLCPNHHSLIDANSGSGFTVDVLIKFKRDHIAQQSHRDLLRSTLLAYIGDRYRAENSVQFQQVDLRGPSVDSMFVDVPVGGQRDGGYVAGLIEKIADASPGDTAEVEAATGLLVTGATQLLLDPEWVGNALLIGGPGQGKSTALQYVCQFHRARHLNEASYGAEQSTLARASTTLRFPIRVDLRKYAQWASTAPKPRERGGKDRRDPSSIPGSLRSLEEYMVEDIRNHVGANQFGKRSFVTLVEMHPLLLALDGLDEVASLSLRSLVATEIASMEARLRPVAADLVVIVATRPGSSLQTLTATSSFTTLRLQKLTYGLRLQYLDKWAEVSELTPETAARLRSTFEDNQNVPHINELASYPMQLAILLHLLYRRQLLPQQRTELYGEYLKTFLDREQTDDKEPLLAEKRRVIENTHAYLGWYLQTKAELGQSSGSITRDELRRLLKAHLAGQPEEARLADEVYSAIADRVLCLVERDDEFEFEVQSLREYFAALYIFQNLSARGTGNSRDDGLTALLERPYWSNVCRFFIGMLTNGEVRALKDNLRLVDRKVDPHPMMRAMAVLILNDRIYDGLADAAIRDVVDIALGGPGVVLAEDGAFDASGTPMRFGDGAGRIQALAHLKARLEAGELLVSRQAVASSLRAHAQGDEGLADWWWARFEAKEYWLETASDLDVLTSLSHQQESDLTRAVSEAVAGRAWISQLLTLGGYDGSSAGLVSATKEDLNDGAIECLGIMRVNTPLAEIVNDGLAAVSHSVRIPAMGQTVRAVNPESSTARPAKFDPLSEEHWKLRLLRIAETWGEGWILNRAVSDIPVGVDLERIRSSIRFDNKVLERAMSLVSDYRSHPADPAWWRIQLGSLSTERDRMFGLISLLENARPGVLIELAADLDAIVGGLSPKRYRAVEHALQMDGIMGGARQLDLQDALRLRRITLSGRSLWLIWLVGTVETGQRAGTQLESALGDVLQAGAEDGRRAFIAATSGKKMKLETLRGARDALPVGGWALETRLFAMNNAIAKEILAQPGEWPADLVQIATDRLAEKRVASTKPLAELAAANGWFQESD